MVQPISIVVVEKDRDRASMIVESLSYTGDDNIVVISDVDGLAQQIAKIDPDLVLVDLANPTRDVLEELSLATSPLDRPVAMFVDQSDENLTRAAIEAGVSAYVVDSLVPDRIKPILSAATVRFNMFRRMRNELAETKRALEERKLIDRAKGLLMKAKGLNEDDAYALMRKTAMDQGKKITDVAQALVTAAELLK